MPMSEIKFSPEAKTDLQQIKVYIAFELCNEKAAVNTVSNIMKHIGQLSAFPLSGAPLSSVVDFKTDYRFLVCENYTAFYRVQNDTVYIVRVLYGRRDYMRILFGEPPEN